MDAYAGNRDATNELALEASAIGPAILAMMKDQSRWKGTATELLSILEDNAYADSRTRKRADWPKKPNAMSGALKGIISTLRRVEVEVTFHRTGHARTILITRLRSDASSSSQASSIAGESDLPSMVKDEDVTQGNHPPANVPSPSKQPGGVRSEPNDDDDDAQNEISIEPHGSSCFLIDEKWASTR